MAKKSKKPGVTVLDLGGSGITTKLPTATVKLPKKPRKKIRDLLSRAH